MSSSSGAGHSCPTPYSTSSGAVDFKAFYIETCRLEALMNTQPNPTNLSNIRKIIANHRRAIEIFENRLPPSADNVSSRPTTVATPSSSTAARSNSNTVTTGAGRLARRFEAEDRRVLEKAIMMLTERVEALEKVLEFSDRPELFMERLRQLQ